MVASSASCAAALSSPEDGVYMCSDVCMCGDVSYVCGDVS